MTRVLYLLHSLAGGGAERAALHVLNHIDREEFDLRLGILYRGGAFLAEVAPADLLVPTLGQGWINYGDLRSFSQMLCAAPLMPIQQYGLLRRFDPHVVVTCPKGLSIGLFSLGVRGRGRAGWIACVQNNTTAQIKGVTRGRLSRGFVRRLTRATYRAADRVLAASHGVGDDLCHQYGVDRQRLRVIHNGVDIAEVLRGSQAPCPVEGRYVLAVGQLLRQKGIDILLRAHARYVAPRGVRLVVLGSGPELPALRDLTRELGANDSVSFLGFQANPWRFMARASALALPSRWEGFGNVIIEAMACGVPVVVTDCASGPAEIVRDDTDGIVVPVEDADALGRALASLLDHPATAIRLGAAGRLRADAFAVGKMVAGYASLFRETAALSMSRP